MSREVLAGDWGTVAKVETHPERPDTAVAPILAPAHSLCDLG